MKLRMKYTKTGVLRYIGHLDIMRLFQKAIRRAGLDVKYTKGFSPHQMISFAAPMPLGMTSEGEYFDGEFLSVTTTEDMMNRLNDTLPEEVRILDVVRLPDDAKPSMALVCASDYFIYHNVESEQKRILELFSHVEPFYEREEIPALMKTKSKEEPFDAKSYLYGMKNMTYEVLDEHGGERKKEGIYLMLSAGSKMNVKPDLIMRALAEYAGVTYDPCDYRIHRLETYFMEKDKMLSLSASGERF